MNGQSHGSLQGCANFRGSILDELFSVFDFFWVAFSLRAGCRSLLEGLPLRMMMEVKENGIPFEALLGWFPSGPYSDLWYGFSWRVHFVWQKLNTDLAGTDWQHLSLPCGLSDMSSLTNLMQYLFVTTILSPILACFMVCWVVELHYISVLCRSHFWQRSNDRVTAHLHYLAFWSGGVYTTLNLTLTFEDVETVESTTGIDIWGVRLLTAARDCSMYIFGAMLAALILFHGWRQFWQRCSFPLTREAGSIHARLPGKQFGRFGLRALIMCMCIVVEDYKETTHYMANLMPPYGSADPFEPWGDSHCAKHLPDVFEGLSSWSFLETPGEEARELGLYEKPNRACRFCARERPQRVATANAFLIHFVPMSYVEGGNRCLTRGLGGSHPLTCPSCDDSQGVSEIYDLAKANEPFKKVSRLKPRSTEWEMATRSMNDDFFSLMQGFSWKSGSSSSGYVVRGHDNTQRAVRQIEISLPDSFWQQIDVVQTQFSDVHLYLHGLKGKHIATRTLKVYGRKKGILPSLHSRIEWLWHDHYDRRESALLYLVEPQPISAAVNGQVHLILDLWPSLQGTPVLSQWTIDDEPGCALQSHRLQSYTPFDEILIEGDLPREIENGMKVAYTHRGQGYGRHDVLRFLQGSKFDFDLKTKEECLKQEVFEGRIFADFSIDPLQDSTFLMQVRPLMEDMLVRHIRRVRGGNVRIDVLTRMHHAEHIQQLQRDLRIVTHNPDLPLGHNIRSRWVHTFGRRSCYIFPVWPSPSSGRGPEPHYIVTTYIGHGLIPALIEYETVRSFRQASFVFRTHNWLSVQQVFDQVNPQNQCPWGAECTLRCGAAFYEWYQYVPLYEGIFLRLMEIERDDPTDESATCDNSEDLEQMSSVEAVSSKDESFEEEHVSFMQTGAPNWQEEFDLEEESFRQALAELPSTAGGLRDMSACLIPANEGMADPFRSFLDSHFALQGVAMHTIYTWVVTGHVAVVARVCVMDARLWEWRDTEQDWPVLFACAEPQPAPLSLRSYPIDVVGLLRSQRARQEKVCLVDILYVGQPRRVAVLCKSGDRLRDLASRVSLGHYCQLEGVRCFLTWNGEDESRVWEYEDFVEEKHASAFQLHLRGQPRKHHRVGPQSCSFMQLGSVISPPPSVLHQYARQWFRTEGMIAIWIHPQDSLVQEHSTICGFSALSDVYDQCETIWKDFGLMEPLQIVPIEPPPVFLVIPRPHVVVVGADLEGHLPVLRQVFLGRRMNLVSILLEGRYPPIGVVALFQLASPQHDCNYGAICYATYQDQRYQYYHDIPVVGGTFVKLHEFPHETEPSTTCDSVSPASSATWDDSSFGDNTATPGDMTPTLDAHDLGGNTATPARALRELDEEQNILFQTYAVPRTFQVDWPQDFVEATETEEELEELMDTLSFHTSVFGFERLNEEVLAYREAFGHFPTFEALYVDDRLEDSTFLFREQDWSREAFVATVRLFLEGMIDRNEFSAIAFVQKIPTPYEQGGNDLIFVIVEKSYAPLRVMICVVITFDLEDSPEIYALSVPQFVWSKDLVRDLQMEGVCRDPRFDCLLRHGLLEMPVVVAWQPYQGMKLNLDIKMLTCSSLVPRFHIMTSRMLEAGNPSENIPEDGVSLMQQARIMEEENDMPTTLSTQRADTESLCNGYSSRGPIDIAPHFMNQAQQLEELRKWPLELMGNENSIALYVFERNEGDVSTYRILLGAEVLGGQPRFAHWIRRELAALWNVHARIFPLLPAPFTDLRIAVLLPRAFGFDLPVLLEINDGQDSWREIHVIQQAVTINSLIWRSRLPAIVPSTLSYQAMLTGEMADPNDLVPCNPGQRVTIIVGALGQLGANGTTLSSFEPGLPSLTSLASSQSNSIRPGARLEEPVNETGEDALDEHTIMQLPMGGGSDVREVFSWFLEWDQRDSIQQQSRAFSLPRDTDLESGAIQTWNDICSSDHPLVVLISPFIQEAGFRPPAVLVVEYINQLYQPVFIDLETSEMEAKGGFLLRDLHAMCVNDIFDQVLPQHRCRTVANCFVRLQGHWYEWDEDVQIRAGDYLQMLEYTESDDEHSTLCGSERQNELALSETSEESDCLQFLQLKVWHREAGTGLPPPGNGVYWESKCLDAMDDLLHCPDGDHVVDFLYPSRTRPIPTPARSGVLPRVVSINDALIDDRAPELQIQLGLSATEIEHLMDFDPVAEQLETLFDGSDLDEHVHHMLQAAPKCIPDLWNPADSHSVRIFTDGSYINGSAAWSFVVVACYCDRQEYVGYQSGAIPLQGHPDCLLDTHGSAVCAEQHALIWASWWLLRYWRLAVPQTPIVFLWDSEVAGRQAEGLYGASSALGRLLRGLQIALQQLTPADVGHLHVPAHRGHLYNEVADTLAKQAHGKCPACPDAGLLLRMVQKLGHLDHLWLFVHQSQMIPSASHGNIRWKPTSATAFPKELLIAQLLPGEGQEDITSSKDCFLQLASYNALSLLGDRGDQTLHAEQGRVQLLRSQFESKGLHVVGIQEARTEPGMIVSHTHIRFCSGKAEGGLYGVELWICRGLQFADGIGFHPGEFLVAYAEPRIMIVKYQGQLGTFGFLVAHAPHTGTAPSERREWWDRLQTQVSCTLGELECIVFLDANATAPTEETVHFGGYTQGLPNKNTPFLEAFVHRNGLFAPSTFEALQHGPPETWTHRATGKRSRIDYVLLPLSWKWAQIDAWVDTDIHVGHAGFDHDCTCLGVSWKQLIRRQSRTKRIDDAALRNPQNQDWVREIWASCPQPDWSMNASQHAALITNHLQKEALRLFPKKQGRQHREHVSEESRELHRRMTSLRRALRSLKKHDNFSLCAVTFRHGKRIKKGRGLKMLDRSGIS